MRPKGDDGNWDLTAVIDLIYTLSASKDEGANVNVPQPSYTSQPTTPIREDDDQEYQLGNFDRLWQFLEQPLNVEPPTVIPLSDSDREAITVEDSNLEVVNAKGVRWRDEVEGADLEENDEIGDTNGLVELSKAQRKKKRHRKRQQELQINLISRPNTPPAPSDNESESEPTKLQRSNGRRSIIDHILHGRPPGQISKDAVTTLGSPQDKHPLRSTTVFGDNGLPISNPAAIPLSVGVQMLGEQEPLAIAAANKIRLMKRGRPVAKRVLVGSDNFPAIQEAKLLGYETNILDRVHKAKELTPRQKKYRNGNGTSGASSGSETNATHAPEKWVEQAVDEILHLKILESVVDAHEPSIIVLATGDAAEAEYSGGFLKMVERALQKGWKVELVSFRRNISSAYKRNEFRSKWGPSFKIIELDDFVEELRGV
ncbi:MAG: hypothetical protein Q9187_002203 [Circinaria calcarea]